MEFKGTKGNWEVTPYQNVYCGITRICTIGDYVEITEEIKHNALLISKAPEMLEMLKFFVERFDNLYIDGTDVDMKIKESKQLIKEATEIH